MNKQANKNNLFIHERMLNRIQAKGEIKKTNEYSVGLERL